MKAMNLIFISFFVTTICAAQSTVEMNNSLMYGNYQTKRIDEIPYVPKTPEHALYIEDNWLVGNLITENDQKVEQMLMRYDLTNHRMEIKMAEDNLRALPMYEIKRFELIANSGNTRQFINNHVMRHEEVPISGIFEVVENGEVILFCHLEYELKDPNYVPQLNVGNRDYEAILKKTYYFGRGYELFKVGPTAKKNLNWLGKHQTELKEFMKKNSLHFYNKEDLGHVIEYFNQLETGHTQKSDS